MKFCPVVPEICHGQVHGARKERRITRTRTRTRIIIIIIIRNGAKRISLSRPTTMSDQIVGLRVLTLKFVGHFGRNMSDLRV
jgi:hypothetical protein